MEMIFAVMDPQVFAVAMMIALLAGVIKGIVGFAMPMIMISGLSSLISPELALAGLIVPTLLANGWQALRQGPHAAWQSVAQFRVFLGVGLAMLLISSQLVRVLPASVLLMGIGAPVALFAVLQLLGWQLRLPDKKRGWIEAAIGGFAGFIGGMSGVWGPPTVAYLTALGTPKRDHIRVQGVVYGLGAVALFGAHIGSGVLRAQTLPFSLALVFPSILGMWVGLQVQDRIDHVIFRRATLAVLLIAGLNLVRRGMVG
ncbi:MAG: sulfite exporter TauE/SafE family protein [Rhodobacterales bacterium]|nr:sulfite exporter TauE/SafE family protein [Rhodobacterales bacterium]